MPKLLEEPNEFFHRAAIDGFLPAGSAGKKVCVCLRMSAVNKKNRNNPACLGEANRAKAG